MTIEKYKGPEYSVWAGPLPDKTESVPIKITSGAFTNTVFYFHDIKFEEPDLLNFSLTFIDLEYCNEKFDLGTEDTKVVDLIGLDATTKFYDEIAGPIMLDLIDQISGHPEMLKNTLEKAFE